MSDLKIEHVKYFAQIQEYLRYNRFIDAYEYTKRCENACFDSEKSGKKKEPEVKC